MNLQTYTHTNISDGKSTPDTDILADQFSRTFDYIRIAVNEQCNLRCVYCMPGNGIHFKSEENLLSTNEILRIIDVVSQLGVKKIRLTGGEPLLRKDIIELIENANNIQNVESIHLTTNGLLLEKNASRLKNAGLRGINISLDTLNDQKYVKITRRNSLAQVKKGIEKAIQLGFSSVKINVVAMRGFNDDEIEHFAELSRVNPITVRFIELMPFDTHQIWKTGKFYSAEKITEDLTKQYPALTPCNGSKTEHRVFHIPGYCGKIAIIPSYTRDICGTCNRIRLTADGKILNCLYTHKEFDLRGVIRNGSNNTDIVNLFKQAMWGKMEDGWIAQKMGNDQRESMTQIGG
ncbi:MAG TPA: GTP 3',8-cyclase MoaA [Candidatus Marinimicrobia bacterium]|jgi:cyclic pyranopterin phosphate synthase|nr:GTP 3',8-cyclase MoaA [Candidatus Neomarinimicrobiota bacterium]MDP6143623.1 GTP 3',8-cyclase MoaA [Candidatus Neomarinimicrobiota bacterium]MDP6262006.1 GTP 3',8-cyclase MoaA [Candidatus Neomarinimicrobiota bacterium]MDP7126062.1 GTP 3',8-cyclase MoaA [Candidatus Neomarinimicrobiota bacterium]MDP7337392.1 GTP 3',8-cyclase MoaA [Candidatus Neomarinimicrobiota bacterium]|tara:strand:+ start:1626 stop:2669 length:1044 start_codon:yes stop_codon:yes gene_type:complete